MNWLTPYMPHIQIIMFLFNGVLGLLLWVARKEFVTRTEYIKRCASDDFRLTAIETTMATMPTNAVITELLLKLTAVTGELKVFDEKVINFRELTSRMQQQIDRVDNFLRERGE